MSARRRVLGGALTALGLGGLLYLHHWATDFPAGDPVRVVDAALIARLRGEPGLHVPLDPGYRLEVPLELADDPVNRRVYGTSVDLRERRPRQSVHIQVKAGRGAIHTDDHNPKAGVIPWLLHGTLDVPATPLALLAAAGLALLLWPARRSARTGPA